MSLANISKEVALAEMYASVDRMNQALIDGDLETVEEEQAAQKLLREIFVESGEKDRG